MQFVADADQWPPDNILIAFGVNWKMSPKGGLYSQDIRVKRNEERSIYTPDIIKSLG